MSNARLVLLPLVACALAACESEAERQADATEDRIEQEAETSATAAGDAEAALGLTERQLLDAELRAADGTELGDVELVRRDASGAVTGLVVEIEDSDPDRFVVVPLDGLTTRRDGDDWDLQTTMTTAELAALPDADMTAGAMSAGTPAAQQ